MAGREQARAEAAFMRGDTGVDGGRRLVAEAGQVGPAADRLLAQQRGGIDSRRTNRGERSHRGHRHAEDRAPHTDGLRALVAAFRREAPGIAADQWQRVEAHKVESDVKTAGSNVTVETLMPARANSSTRMQRTEPAP